MKTYSILLTLLIMLMCISSDPRAQEPSNDQLSEPNSVDDPWIGKDKFLHFTISAGLVLTSYYVYREEFNNSETGSYYFSGGLTISLGALKEYYDWHHPHRHQASWRDLIADIAGTATGLTIAYIMIN